MKTNGQNILLNGDFENYSDCPIHESWAGFFPYEITKCTGWYAPTFGSSDYFNTCATGTNVSIPQNFAFGYQNTYSGDGYLGFFAYSVDYVWYSDPWYEYISGQLVEPMIAGHQYKINFKLSLSNFSDYAVSNIGIYLSANPIGSSDTSTSTLPLNFIPQIVSPSNYFYDDTLNWMNLEGIYNALGGEKHITIGNFNDTTETEKTRIQFTHIFDPYSYYYIDAGEVIDITKIEPIFFVPNFFSPNGDGINDIWKAELGDNELAEIVIYDRWGVEIMNSNKTSYWDGYTNSGIPCSDGVYYYILEVINLKNETEQYQGYISLIR